MKINPAAKIGAILLFICLGIYLIYNSDANRQKRMVAVVNQFNSASLEFFNAGNEMKKHTIHAMVYDDLGQALNAYNTRFQYIDESGCPEDFKTAVSNYKVALAFVVQFHIHHDFSNANDVYQNLQNAATRMDSVCRKYNIHFENINSFTMN